MQTNPAVEQNKTLNGPRARRISPLEKEKRSNGRFGIGNLTKPARRAGVVVSVSSWSCLRHIGVARGCSGGQVPPRARISSNVAPSVGLTS